MTRFPNVLMVSLIPMNLKTVFNSIVYETIPPYIRAGKITCVSLTTSMKEVPLIELISGCLMRDEARLTDLYNINDVLEKNNDQPNPKYRCVQFLISIRAIEKTNILKIEVNYF